MMKRSRYFLVGALVLLVVGLGAGLFAYYKSNGGLTARGLPAELRFVPADATMVAYADVRAIMKSEMRQELERLAIGPRRGQQEMHDFAGIDIEKDVNRVVAYIQPDAGDRPPHALLLAQGTFNQSTIEQFLKDHEGVLQDYQGHRVFTRMVPTRGPQSPDGTAAAPDSSATPTSPTAPEAPGVQPGRDARPDDSRGGRMGRGRRGGGPMGGDPDGRGDGRGRMDGRMGAPRPGEELAVAFLQPDLIAIGPLDRVRASIDGIPASAAVATNADMMKMIDAVASSDAWVSGNFDAVSRRLALPPSVRTQVPALKMVSASVRIDGSVKATLRAEAKDPESASQFRDVVRGGISFARLAAGSKPEWQDPLKSIELSGTGSDLELSFLVTQATLRAMAPGRRGGRPDGLPAQPEAPTPPASPATPAAPAR